MKGNLKEIQSFMQKKKTVLAYLNGPEVWLH